MSFSASAQIASPLPFAKVDVFTETTPALEAWGELEECSPCSIYQTRAWLVPWTETLGRKAALTPAIALATSPTGTPVALLSLGLARRGPLKIAVFLGGKDSNLNLPLLRSGIAWSESAIRCLFRDAAQALRSAAPDVFVLANQPLSFGGHANPLAQLPHQPSPSAAFGTALAADPETFFAAKQSKDARKKLRKKEAKLALLGPLVHEIAASELQRREILAAFVAQKLARFREKGIRSEFDTPEMQAFIERAGAGIELHALRVGSRIVATYGGAAHGGQWSGMFNSFDADEEIAKSSPADLLLMRIMAKACRDGLARFDLGIGEARYKAALCDEPLRLFDCVVPVSMAGHGYSAYVKARQHAKRIVKSQPRLMAVVDRLRRSRAGY